MLLKAAEMLHDSMRRNGVHAPSAEVIAYALNILGNGLSIMGLSLIIAAITGVFAEMCLILIVFAVLRMLSGGYHVKSSLLCIVLSTAIISIIPHFALERQWILVLTIASLVIFLIFSPSNMDKYARIPPRYHPLLKAVSSAIVASNLLVKSGSLAVAFGIQALLLVYPLIHQRKEVNKHEKIHA